MARADLHIHTTASDGKIKPEKVIDLAAENKLATIAITDHDTCDGYLKVKNYAFESGVRLIPGVEITTEYKDRECHILAYGFNPNHTEFKKKLTAQRKIRVERAHKMVENLNKLGFDLDFDDVIGEAGLANISRVHIAKVLVNKGYASSMNEVFNRYLGDDKPGYARSEYTSVTDMISLIKRAGGVSILAHPGLMYIWEDLKFFLNAGIDGIEFMHPTHNFKLQKKYKDWAQNYDLLLSGGSDFHGKARDLLHFGTITVDDSYADAILNKASERQQILETN